MFTFLVRIERSIIIYRLHTPVSNDWELSIDTVDKHPNLKSHHTHTSIQDKTELLVTTLLPPCEFHRNRE